MLHRMKDLEGYTIGAIDGMIGHVKDFYLDDEAWVIRYLVVETGDWLSHRHVLISPIAINQPNWSEKIFPAAITQEQVKNSPGIDTDEPVSGNTRWITSTTTGIRSIGAASEFWGNSVNPGMMLWDVGNAATASEVRRAHAEKMRMDSLTNSENQPHDDPHLRSGNEILKYEVRAADGDIGHVQGLLVDEKAWAIRYLIVNTSNWWLGHQVLMATQWIESVSWKDRKVSVSLTRSAVRGSPPYPPGTRVGRDEEARIYDHYGRHGYWAREVQLQNPEFRNIPSAPPTGIDRAL